MPKRTAFQIVTKIGTLKGDGRASPTLALARKDKVIKKSQISDETGSDANNSEKITKGKVTLVNLDE